MFPRLYGETGHPSTTAMLPRRSIAATHVNRPLHIYAKRKWGTSEMFGQPGPSYTPYGVGELSSSPPNCYVVSDI